MHLHFSIARQRETRTVCFASEVMDAPVTSSLEDTLLILQKQLARKQTFESAVASLTRNVSDQYASVSQSDKKLIYAAVCRTATLLKTRYTTLGFWMAGLELFEAMLQVVGKPEERENMELCIRRAHEIIGDSQKEEVPVQPEARRNPGFLFEGQLTVGPEPPRPAWMVAQNLLGALVAQHEQSSTSSGETLQAESRQQLEHLLAGDIEELIERMDGPNDFGSRLEAAMQASLQEVGHIPDGTPPASKEEVAKLPVLDVTDSLLKQFGEGIECAVCREQLVTGDKMQEMPCKHYFHPDCLKPWLDQHNSCPICRFELQTDDHEYESKKEQDKQFEEERKGAENALPGGEFMYV